METQGQTKKSPRQVHQLSSKLRPFEYQKITLERESAVRILMYVHTRLFLRFFPISKCLFFLDSPNRLSDSLSLPGALEKEEEEEEERKGEDDDVDEDEKGEDDREGEEEGEGVEKGGQC